MHFRCLFFLQNKGVFLATLVVISAFSTKRFSASSPILQISMDSRGRHCGLLKACKGMRWSRKVGQGAKLSREVRKRA